MQDLSSQKKANHLSNLWILLNQLNLMTKTFPNENLSPYVRNKRKLLSIMQQVYLDAHLLNIKNEQVVFLEATLKEIYPLKKDYNFNDESWYESASAQEQSDRGQIKQLILKAHREAFVL